MWMEKNYKKLGYLNETALSLFFKFNTRIKDHPQKKEINQQFVDSLIIADKKQIVHENNLEKMQRLLEI